MEQKNNELLNGKAAVDAIFSGHALSSPKHHHRGLFWFNFNGNYICHLYEGPFLSDIVMEIIQSDEFHVVEMTSEMAIVFVKRMRIGIDQLLSAVTEELKLNRETAIVKTELQFAFMYLGYLLGEIGAANPYPESFNPKSPVIEKHADKAPDYISLGAELNLLDETGKVKLLRKMVSMYLDCIGWLSQHVLIAKVPLKYKVPHPYVDISSEVAKHLLNANLFLGQQLNNIRIASEAITE